MRSTSCGMSRQVQPLPSINVLRGVTVVREFRSRRYAAPFGQDGRMRRAVRIAAFDGLPSSSLVLGGSKPCISS